MTAVSARVGLVRRVAAAALRPVGDRRSGNRRGKVSDHGRERVSGFDDIEFDFFDEPQTTEGVRARGRQRLLHGPDTRRGGPPPPPLVLAPLLRLAALIVIVIAVVVTLVSLADAQLGTSKRDEYAAYLNKVGAIAQSSQELGTRLSEELLSSRLRISELARSLQIYAEQ